MIKTTIRKYIFVTIMIMQVFVLSLTSCRPSSTGRSMIYDKPDKPNSDTSIHIKTVYDNISYEILEIDGHIYLSRFHGGIIHLESCPCKTKNNVKR